MKNLKLESSKKQCQKLYVRSQTSQAMTRSDLWDLMQKLWWSILLSESLQRASIRVDTLHGQKHTSNFTENLCIMDTCREMEHEIKWKFFYF